MNNQIYYLNTDKFPAIANDYSEAKTRAEKITKQKGIGTDNSVFTALEVIPTVRRTASIPDKIDKGDYLTTAGILAYTAVNAREDLNDVISAGKQIRSKLDPTYHYDQLYDRKNYQHEFSATRNVIGEEALYKARANGNFFAEKIVEIGNTTVDNTKFGQFVKKTFKISEDDVHKIDKIKNIDGSHAYAYKFKSSVLGGKTVARAMKRTTVAGVAVIGLFELPKIAKETMKGDNFFEHVESGAKQVVISAGNVVMTTAGIAICGAIGAKHLGATGSLIGMGVGAIAGTKLSNQLQSAIA